MVKNILALIILSTILFSCAGPLSIQKRRYNRGYHFSMAHHVKSTKQSNVTKGNERIVLSPNNNEAAEILNPVVIANNSQNALSTEVNVAKEQQLLALSMQPNLSHQSAENSIHFKNENKDNNIRKNANAEFKTKKLTKAAIVKRVIRKVLRKIGFLCLMLGGLLYLASLVAPEIYPLAMLFIFAGVLLIIIAILTRLT